MIRKVSVVVLRTAGTNCDAETVFAFQSVGAQVDLIHMNQILSREKTLDDYQILALPGGFTYGDDIAAGRILANELRLKLSDKLRQFLSAGKLIIGICNGFQVMVKAGLLPNTNAGCKQGTFHQTVTLMRNDSAKFEDRWVHLKCSGRCQWTKNIDRVVRFPVAHGEGKFVVRDKSMLRKLKENNQIVFRYCSPDGLPAAYPDNPNGSDGDIAGITDPTGRCLGLMPHPERHFLFSQHPSWSRRKKTSRFGDGALIFQNGVDYVKEALLS